MLITVNEREREFAVPTDTTLLGFLRDYCELRGTKSGCEIGYCGACTVLLDGQPVHACCLLAAQCHGRTVETIEGVAGGDASIQRDFADADAAQCGVCIPGFIMSGIFVRRSAPDPGLGREEFAREVLLGNICRCGNYSRIVQAVLGPEE
ncbi:MAG: 2Fe-2S iron-sulfur cluster binding domain-containing protein [Dehalococcoidia bacterium]|nr:2Fe-2S iron-sulfur cluster binding domain-containing protein [Dehalococcoidia bacterium]